MSKEYWINVYKNDFEVWYGSPRANKNLAKAIGNSSKYLIYRIHVRLK